MSCTEPMFNFQRLIELHSTDLRTLCQTPSKLHILVTRLHLPTATRSLIGSHMLEWRDCLVGSPAGGHGTTKIIEVKEVGETEVTVGLLEVSLEVVPRGVGFTGGDAGSGGATEWLTSEEVGFQLKRESRQDEEVHRLFYVYSKQWWNDYLQIRPSHAERLVKIFAEDEDGKRVPVTNFVNPIKSRYIESPRHAARMEIWQSPHTILTLSKATQIGHALLLTSLLLGFSLNAYVTLGTRLVNNKQNKKASSSTSAANVEVTSWVTTVSVSDTQGSDATFWDPVSGERFSSRDLEAHGYRSVGCVFNDEGFWGTVRVSDSVDGLRFNVNDGGVWKPVARDAVMSMKRISRSTPNFPILPFHSVPFTTTLHNSPSAEHDHHQLPSTTSLELDLETVLRHRVSSYREDYDMTCVWDFEMENLLSSCLWGLEMGKVVGRTGRADGEGKEEEFWGCREFQEGVRMGIPDGHTFKGFPCNFNTLNPSKIFTSMVKSQQCREVLLTRGDKVRFGIRVRCFPYAEGVVATWVMVAVRFRSL
ncbi:Centrosomal protein of 76 kDa [Blyttiomyces sp. JEL0837]|nr:Centrosomal protein of 76 kDa [Blyttiomyces sp. JEL0837]